MVVKKRVAIIGAGASGLPAIRHAILYDVEPVCFECTEHVGGLWKYTEGGTNVHGQECKSFPNFLLENQQIINFSIMCYEVHSYQHVQGNDRILRFPTSS